MTANQTMRAVSLISDYIVHELAHSLNQAPEEISPDLPFVDMGADSLILAEALQEINRRYRVSLPIGEIYENVNTIAKVARFIQQNGDWESVVEPTAPAALIAGVGNEEAGGAAVSAPLPAFDAAGAAGGGADDRQSVEHIVRQQLELMERQLALLGRGKAPAAKRGTAAPAPQPSKPRLVVDAPAKSSARVAATAAATAAGASTPGDRFSAFSVKLEHDSRKDDAEKAKHIAELTARFNAKTPQSKQMAQTYRHVLSDNRVSAGFRPFLKELVYPILAEKAQGAHLVDIDGNEYIDFTMGFGVHLTGHSPDFVVENLREQLERGTPIGPQSPLAGRVAGLICEMTGNDRLVFCNSGTEATMTAVRLARAKTNRDKVVIFRNSYHGTFDGFLARSNPAGDGVRPASIGTPESLVQDTIVLDYGEQSALDYVARHGKAIAAVLVEPVQSRVPSLQPTAFLKEMRRITTEQGVALIFDEVISGFRCAQGGAQEYFGVKADICTYGKIIGGGMPIGAVAGKADYLDGIDGGWWQYGDDSHPTASMIFFAGTFSKHPLTMAASVAVLEHIKASGKQLYDTLNENTRELSARLDAVFEEEGVDIRIEHFSSLFRFSSKGNIDLFFYHLMDEGIFIWEGRNCFLSTAHSAEDMTRLVDAVGKVCRDLAPRGLLPLRDGANRRKGNERYAIADAQQRFFQLERSGTEGSAACNVCFGFLFEKPVDIERLTQAVSGAVLRQDALWYRFDIDQATQQPQPGQDNIVERIDVPREATPERVERLLRDEQKTPLDIQAGRNIRPRIHVFEDGQVLLGICAHHLTCDGWGLNVLLHRIADLYNQQPGSPDSGGDVPYVAWLEHEAHYKSSERYPDDQQFWRDRLQAIASRQTGHGFGSAGQGNKVAARKGGRATLMLDEEVNERFLAKARGDGVTAFSWLLSAFQLFLSRVFQENLPVIGIPFANRTSKLKQVVGNCVNLVPLAPFQGGNARFEDTLAYTKQAMGDLLGHSRFPYHEMCGIYRELTGQKHETPVNITFNVEPISEMPPFGDSRPNLIAPLNSHIEFDLMFNIFPMKNQLRIELDYNADRFAEDTVYGWLYLFAKIIENNSAPAALEVPINPVAAKIATGRPELVA